MKVSIIMGIITIMTIFTAGVTMNTQVQAQTSDPALNSLLGQTDDLISDIGRSFEGDQYKEQVQDTTYNPPSTNEELNDICLRQAEQWSNDPQGYCNAEISGQTGCSAVNLTIEECYAWNFVDANIVPKNVWNSANAKYDASIAANKARTGAIGSANEFLYGENGIYGPNSGYAESFCMPYCN